MKPTLYHCWRTIGVYGGDQSCALLAEAIHCRNCNVFAEAARTLFDRESDAEPAEGLRRDVGPQAESKAAVVFRLAGHWLGLPPSLVAEVAAAPSVRRLAHRTAGRVEGVVNLRGELYLCVSLVELLGLGARPPASEATRMVLIRDPQGAMLAFRCEEILGLQHFPHTSGEPPPDTLPEPLRDCVAALFPSDRGHVAMLDRDVVLKLLEGALFA